MKRKKLENAIKKLKQRGYTIKELRKLGVNYKELKKHKFGTYELCITRNEWNEQIFFLLKKEIFKQEIKRKNWTFEKSKDQPLLTVFLPTLKKEEKLEILPLSDLHIGAKDVKMKKLLSYIELIKETDNMYSFVNGDLLELGHRGSIGAGVYEQTLNPGEQIKEVIKLLSPIAHKLLFITSGNHDLRASNMVGIDVCEIIAKELRVPYFKYTIHMNLNWREKSYKFYVWHGHTSSQTPGGIINAVLNKTKGLSFTHFVIMS